MSTNTNTQHTPGPWEVSKHATPDYAPQFGIYSEQSADGRDLATVEGGNAKANARLIAAAPELLSTLELLRAAVIDTPALDSSEDWTRLIETARAAIAKAKGGAA